MDHNLIILLLFGALSLLSFVVNRSRARPVAHQRSGFGVQTRRIVQRVSKNHVIIWTEYRVSLPAPLDKLSLIDADAHQRWKAVEPGTDVRRVGAPRTDDQVFNGLFDFVERPTEGAAGALGDPEIRRVLLQVREMFGGLWIDAGDLRVLQATDDNAEMIDIDMETLTDVLTQLRSRLSEASGEVAFDLAGDAADAEDSRKREPVDVSTDWRG